MNYLLMAVSIFFAALNSLILRKFKNRTFKTHGDVFFFNGAISLIWIVLLFAWSLISGDLVFSLPAVLYGAVYGVILCMFLYFKTESLASGPVSLTTLIGSCAFIIATGFGIFYNNERVSLFQWTGMALILIALIMCIFPKKNGEKLTLKWFFFCFMFLLAGGFVGIFYKIFGLSDAKDQVNAMMLSAAVTSSLLFFLSGISINALKHEKHPTIDKEALIYILLSGIAGCVYIRLNVSLSKVIPSAIFFPVSNGGMVIISTVAGGLFFREKLNKLQLSGIILGTAAIIINGCGDAIFALF